MQLTVKNQKYPRPDDINPGKGGPIGEEAATSVPPPLPRDEFRSTSKPENSAAMSASLCCSAMNNRLHKWLIKITKVLK